MADWLDYGGGFEETVTGEMVPNTDKDVYGTAGCAAGWTVLLFDVSFPVSARSLTSDEWVDRAARLLGLSADDADHIFLDTDVWFGFNDDDPINLPEGRAILALRDIQSQREEV